MDRYAFMLDAFQRESFRRLRAFVANGRSSFTTWLIVVARRICLDQYRQRYGRPQSQTDSSCQRHRERRQLTDLVGDEMGLALVEASADDAPDLNLQRSELTRVLADAIGALEPEDRLLLRLRFQEDTSVPAIARVLGEGSPFRIYRRLDKVLGLLRRRLQSVGVEDEVP